MLRRQKKVFWWNFKKFLMSQSLSEEKRSNTPNFSRVFHCVIQWTSKIIKIEKIVYYAIQKTGQSSKLKYQKNNFSLDPRNNRISHNSRRTKLIFYISAKKIIAFF